MKYEAIRGGGSDYVERWSPDPGYSVNDVAKGGQRAYLKAGDRVWIRKMSSISSNWNGSTTQSFMLEANNQTVTLN
nr:MAG TPA: Complement C1q-like protein [Herelleviridae sp.]